MLICSCATSRQLTPQMYGAKGDGVTDDYVAIQAMLDAGGDIYFPEGTYRVSNALHVTKSHTHLKLHKKAIVECYERTTGTHKYGNAGATIVFNSLSTINSPTTDGEQIVDVGIEGGIIRNRAPENQKETPLNNENAIGFTHCRHFYCRGVTIEFCNRKGVTLQYFNDDGIIEGCIIKDCGVHGITVESNSNNVIIRNNKVFMNKTALSKGENTANGRNYGMHIIESRDVKIINNTLMTDCGVGIYSNDCEAVSLKGNRIVSTEERALVLSARPGSSSEYVIKGNTLQGVDYSLDLSGLNTISEFIVDGNTCDTKIRFTNGIVLMKNNIASSCVIDRPVGAPRIERNQFRFVNVTNATESTRPQSKGNILEEAYRNWGPAEGKDIFIKKEE